MIQNLISSTYTSSLLTVVSVLSISILAFYIVGHFLAVFRRQRDPKYVSGGIGPLESALLGLLSLLLSFTFSISAARYDKRRELIVKEANDIGTLIKRSDMYTTAISKDLKKSLKAYVLLRINYYQTIDEAQLQRLRFDADSITTQMWVKVTAIAKEAPEFYRDNQMIPALNHVMDDVLSRDALRLAIVPPIIIHLLFALTIIGGFILGFTKKQSKDNWILFSMYLIMTVSTIYAILDLDRPRRGMIKTETTHQKIEELLLAIIVAD